MNDHARQLANALWRIYRRPERPTAWVHGGNLPWDDPAFSERMLREHLDERHGAASRVSAERARQIDWLWQRLGLTAGHALYDITCGPGLYAVPLAERGVTVTGVDFAPAAVNYARNLAAERGVTDRCTFVQADVRTLAPVHEQYDAALVLYGQIAVMTPAEAETLLAHIRAALRPGGALCIELLDQTRIDRKRSTWWYTDDGGLWGDAPYLHLGERFWDEAGELSLERYHILHLETGALDEVLLCDQSYSVARMTALLRRVGFSTVDVYPAWDGLPIYDAAEWVVFVGRK